MMRTLITGADRGLGAALARAALERGDRVWAACLGSNPELTAAGAIVIPGVDVSLDEPLRELAGALDGIELDRVISNAGVNESSGGPADADTERMARELQVNVLGAVRVVRAVLPLLAPAARIGIITTGRGAAQDHPVPAGGMNYGYRISKGALNVYGALLAADLRESGFVVALVHPGAINTDLMRRIAAAGGSTVDPDSLPSPEDVAPGVLSALDALSLDESGSWIGIDGSLVMQQPASGYS
jgi:NAD(P)-dependent dehydrogenase (short-subunit alcohol dehydrogenase family)